MGRLFVERPYLSSTLCLTLILTFAMGNIKQLTHALDSITCYFINNQPDKAPAKKSYSFL